MSGEVDKMMNAKKWEKEPTPDCRPPTPCLLTKVMLVLPGVVLLAALFSAPDSNGEMRKTVTPRVSVQEQYDDNVDLDPKGREESDWITSALPGIALTMEGPRTNLNFDYEASFSFYKEDSDRDTTGHRVHALWDQGLSQHVTFHLSDRFVRSEDPIWEYEDRIEDVQRERRVYYRNTGEASLAYAFGKEDEFEVGYRNRYVDDRSSEDEDSLGHTGFANLDLWFGPRYGISLTPSYTRADFEQESDFDQYAGGLTLNYRWKPKARTYCRYDYTYTDFDPSRDDERDDDPSDVNHLLPGKDKHHQDGHKNDPADDARNLDCGVFSLFLRHDVLQSLSPISRPAPA